MRFLLDENFPLQLQHRLTAAGLESEHIITMGRRGMPDSEIVGRLAVEEDLVFVTQDTEFEDVELGVAKVIISRVPQSLPVLPESKSGSRHCGRSGPRCRPVNSSISCPPAGSSGGRSGEPTRRPEALSA